MVNRTVKILTIDDNQDNLTILKALMTEAFPETVVLSALNGQSGLDIASKEEPDVILLDILMPGMDGFDVCRKLKADKLLRDIPVVFVTAIKSDKESRIRALEAGAEAFLAKPIDESELIAQIHAMLKIRASNIQKRNEVIRLEKTSQENAYRFQSMFDHMSSGAAIYKVLNNGSTGKDYIIMDFNKTALLMEGKEKKDVLGKSLHDLRPNIDEYGLIPAFQKAWQTGKPVFFPAKVYIDEKYNSWYENRIFKLPSGEIAAIYDDVTDRMLIQEKLAESEQKYRQIAENISDVVWTADMDLKTTYVSTSVKKMLGESPEVHMAKTIQERFTPESLRKIHQVLSEELEKDKNPKSDKNRTLIIEVEHYRADGSTIWISMNISFLRDENGNAIGFLGVSRDISTLKETGQNLHKSEQRFRVAQEMSPDGFTILHPVRNETGEIIDFIFVYENQAIARINRTDPQKVINKRLLDLFPAHRGTSVFEAYIHVANTGQSQIVEDVNLGEVVSSPTWLRLVIVSMGEDIAILAQDITERKKNEFEIKQSEERFQLLFNKAPLGYQSLDSEGRFIEVNQKWIDTLGYCKEEVIGKWFGDFLCPEYVDGFRKRFPIFKSQGYIHSEFEMLCKNGQRLFLSFEGKVGYGADGDFKQTHCILQDITNQRKAEKALIESEERYKYLFEHSGVGIGYYSTDGVVISYNKKALENIGGKPEDYIGRSFRDLFPKEQAEIYYARIKKAISSDQMQQYEDYLVLNSEPKWFSSTYTRVMNTMGEVIGVQIASLDITERKHAEEELSESQAILKAAFETSQAGIAIADAPNGKLRYVNKAGLLIRDKSEKELVKNIDVHNYVAAWKILHFDGTPYAENEVPLARAVIYGETCSEEFVIQRDDFEDRYVLANAAPIKDSDNNIKAGIVVFLDITEKRQAEENVRKQNELFASLLELLPVGVFMVDAADGKPLVVNNMGMNLLGSGILPDANEHNLSEVYKAYKGNTKQHYPADEMPVVLGMRGISAHIDDMVVERPDGTRILLEVFGTPVKDKEGKPWASLVTFMDITARKKAESELIYISYHDHLTGLYNRRFFEEEIKKFDKKENLPLSIIMGDVNGLKLINDSFGHDTGDDFLKKAADTIKKACRPCDMIARLGGDEFVVILPKTDSAEAQRILVNIKNLTAKIRIANIELSISLGYDTKDSKAKSIVETMANAENDMYRHKIYERSSMRSKTVDIIMKTLFEKSNREMLHSKRVSEISEAIATKMDYDKDEIGQISTAGLLHDIGKIGIDEKTLNKNGKPDDEEWIELKKHPEMGWRILSSTNEFSELSNIVIAHHEKWDGSGYPNRLKGEEIPLQARIIAVADAYDAMTSERSYRKPLSKDDALEELKRCSGSQFDPKIIDLFLNIVLPTDSDIFRGGGGNSFSL